MTGPTRRAALAAGAAGLLARPALLRAQPASLLEAAKHEGQVSWYTSHTDGETANMAAQAFMQEYPGITVGVVRATAQVVYQRLLQDLKNGIPPCDVFSSTDLGHYTSLQKQNKLARYTPENAKNLTADYAGLDPQNQFFPTLSELVIPIVNTQKVPAGSEPRNWTDLLDPKWRNQVTVGHPAYSGTVGTWVLAMNKLHGWAYFDKLERNKPLIGRSVNDAVGVLNSGERSVGVGPSGLSQVTMQKGNPIKLIQPTDGAVLIVSPSAVMADAPHPNAARLFMEFLLGPRHAALSMQVNRIPVVRGVTAPPSPLDGVKVVRLPVDELVAGMQDAIERWRDTFGT